MPAAPPPLPRDVERRQNGAYYTPASVAAHMATLLSGLSPTSTLLEPAGGDGALVAAALATGHLTPGQIEVWDIDGAAREPIEARGVRFVHRDSLRDAPAGRGRFSHALGNPPYLSTRSQYIRSHRAELQARYGAVGASDTYSMFMLMTLAQLREGGQMVFLVSDTFMTLGAHQRLRELLLESTTLESITLLPPSTFPDANVRTAIVALHKAPPAPGHEVAFIDARASGALDGPGIRVYQASLRAHPGSVLAFEPEQRAVLNVLRACEPLVSICDGGLGTYTRDNATYLAVIERNGKPAAPVRPGGALVPEEHVDGRAWRHYHKRGGTRRWWGPAEHAIRWDDESRSAYTIPATGRAGHDEAGRPRPGVIIAGVATRLSARIATPGALWESNKAFGLFPKDPQRHPAEFLCAILNSTWYATAAIALNHTVSLQWRDLATLPLLPFSDTEIERLAQWGAQEIARAQAGLPEGAGAAAIDTLVALVAARVEGTSVSRQT